MASPIPDHRDIETILRIDVDIAQKELHAATMAFWQVAATVTIEPQAIENAVAQEKRARTNLILALRRFNLFLSDGEVPEAL